MAYCRRLRRGIQKMKTTVKKLKQIIRSVILESNYGYGGHEGGTMAGHSGRGSDMPLPKERPSKQNWFGFKEMVEQGDIEGATDFLDAIGATDPMDQEAFLSDAIELTAGQLAKEWSYRLEQM